MPITRLIFGCQNITGGSSIKSSQRLLDCVLDHGIARLDVAPCYGLGTAESVVGRTVATRSQVKVTTKVGIEPPPCGRFAAYLCEPVRAARRLWSPQIVRRPAGPTQSPGPLSARLDIRNVDPARSLRRSKRALQNERIDTWLTHEALDQDSVAEYRTICATEQQSGHLLKWGHSGEARAIEFVARQPVSADLVIQCSISDVKRVPATADLRLFGIVRELGPIIDHQCSFCGDYVQELQDCLGVVELNRREIFAACLAGALALVPNASIIFSTSRVATIAFSLEALGRVGLAAWANRYSSRHGHVLWRVAED
jgi:hypothetical protein